MIQAELYCKQMSREGSPPVEAESVSFYPLTPQENTEVDDHPQDECGVFAMYAPGEPVIQTTLTALDELQHRGQSGAGIAYVDNDPQNGKPLLRVHKDEGLVPEALAAIYPSPRSKNGFDIRAFEAEFNSPLALGHVRYSTAEGEGHDGAHPHQGDKTGIALVHNGHLTNIVEVARSFGVEPTEESDSALLTKVIDHVTNAHDSLQDRLASKGLAGARYDSLMVALHKVLPRVEGAYCLTITDRQRIIAVRDPRAFHPLAIGTKGDGYVVASESVIFNAIGADFSRDVEPGEIVSIGPDGVHSSTIRTTEQTRRCGFEYIYTSRPDGIVDDVNVYVARKNLGRYLAVDQPVSADVIVGVPASGLAAAAGYAEASGIPIVEGIFPNRYSGRTFIERADTGRQERIAAKYRMNIPEIAGKRVVLVDDSLIKGNTMQQLVSMVRDAGATEVHVRSSAARYENACHMGMDTHNTDLLIARGRTDTEIAKIIGADTVAFNSTDRIQQAVEGALIDRSPAAKTKLGTLCTACATGDYPFPVSDGKGNVIFPGQSLPMRQTVGFAALAGVQG